MAKFCIVALILAAGDFPELKRPENRRELVLYGICMTGVLIWAHFYFKTQNPQGFVDIVLSFLGMKE